MRDNEYTIVEDLVAPGDPKDPHHHMVDYQTQELVSTLWSKYLARARADLAPSDIVPAMRRVSYSLDNECFGGQPLQRGIRVLSRSRRSVVFGAAVWHADDGRFVHQAEMVTVFVRPGAGAVEIPADFWEAVEKIEGRPIPVSERS